MRAGDDQIHLLMAQVAFKFGVVLFCSEYAATVTELASKTGNFVISLSVFTGEMAFFHDQLTKSMNRNNAGFLFSLRHTMVLSSRVSLPVISSSESPGVFGTIAPCVVKVTPYPRRTISISIGEDNDSMVKLIRMPLSTNSLASLRSNTPWRPPGE